MMAYSVYCPGNLLDPIRILWVTLEAGLDPPRIEAVMRVEEGHPEAVVPGHALDLLPTNGRYQMSKSLPLSFASEL